MSANETTSPAQRMNLSVAAGPNPLWTNHYFDCSYCGARYQLGCADELKERCLQVVDNFQSYDASPCWTCGKVNVLTFLKKNLRPSAKSADETLQEDNPS
jgi:hypothetical protein